MQETSVLYRTCNCVRMAQHVELRRDNTGQPWGFKMQGGTDVNMPLFVAHVSPYTYSDFHRLFTVCFE